MERPRARRPAAAPGGRLGGRPGHRAQAVGPEPPGYRGSGGPGARKSGCEHRRHGARSGSRHALRFDDALGRRGRRSGARAAVDRGARLPNGRRRGVTRFEPAGPLRGSLRPPADKSISHRAALFGAMCDTPVSVRNYLYAEDTLSTLDALRALGAAVEVRTNELVIRGVGMRAPLTTTNELLDVGNSGTLMRLLPGWLAGQAGGRWKLDGDASIRRRPVDRIAKPLTQMGATVVTSDAGRPPFTVE